MGGFLETWLFMSYLFLFFSNIPKSLTKQFLGGGGREGREEGLHKLTPDLYQILTYPFPGIGQPGYTCEASRLRNRK